MMDYRAWSAPSNAAENQPKHDCDAENGDNDVDDVVVERQGQQVKGKVFAENWIDCTGRRCAKETHERDPQWRCDKSSDARGHKTDEPGRASRHNRNRTTQKA